MHEYMRRILRAQNKGIIDKGTAAEVQVYHDTGCPWHKGKTCKCDPFIIVHTTLGICHITEDGQVKKGDPGEPPQE